ncbi:hypothetical protein DPI70_24985, partial [Escherichia coli]|nr:hypothetical protein [Escherichia coli]
QNVKTASSFAKLYDAKWDCNCVELGLCLCKFRTYIEEENYDTIPPIDYGLVLQSEFNSDEKIKLWNFIIAWSKTADSTDLSAMLSIKDEIYAFLDIA